MKTVLLGGKNAAGRVALVSDEDFALVTRFSWHIWEKPGKNGGRTNGPYAAATVRLSSSHTTTLYMHKLVTGYRRTDHVDHNGLNNQRWNLRPATVRQNLHNERPRSVGHSSRYKGVGWVHRPGKEPYLRVVITVNGRDVYLGQGFKTEEDAARAYDAAAREAFGQYAYLNFP